MLTLKTPPNEDEASTIRILAGLEADSDELPDSTIKSSAVLGRASRYVFQAVTSRVDPSILKNNLRNGGLPADYEDYNSIRNASVDDFVNQALSVPVSYTHLTLPTTPYV